MPAIPLGGAFRRRLTIAFIVVVAVAGGVLAATSWVLIREYRERAFTDQSVDKAALSLISTPDDLSVTDVDQLLAELERRGGFETLVTAGDVAFSSEPSLGVEDLPDGMAAEMRAGRLVTRDATVDGRPTLVVGGMKASGRSQLYSFFPRQDVITSIEDFRNVLALGWVIAVATAALFGNVVARRTLRPVNEAALASQSLAEGLLDTRLASSSDDEFGRWADSFNHMAEALQTTIGDLSLAAERERRFTADVAHELRTPLTGMVSAASLLEEDLPSLPPGTAQAVELLVEDTRRLRVLVTELLELARFDAGQEEADLEPLALDEALRTVTRSWDGTDRVHVEVDDDVHVLADRARFRRVVGNLVHNALHHGGDGVVVRGRQEGDVVVVEVVDGGPGIDDVDLTRVFDRFFKGDVSRSRGGTGLGLSIAQANARLQGGTLRAHNADGGGACFAFTLPAAPAPGSGARTPERSGVRHDPPA